MSNQANQSSSDSSAAWLGCIADDVTGATDLATNLVLGGLRVVQFLTVPSTEELQGLDCDAIIVALKSRSIPAEQAVEQSLAVAQVLKEHGCQRFFFKYCSTFDSTEQGNIGPVADALLDFLNADWAAVCPAFPRAGRTVYQGHLFVGDQLLNESGMQNHPLNPMNDANLVRFLSLQSSRKVGLVEYSNIEAGHESAGTAMQQLSKDGCQLLVTDCCSDQHLQVLAASVADSILVTGGSGIARFLPDAWRASGHLQTDAHTPTLPSVAGRSMIVAGSCSLATQRQVAKMQSNAVVYQIDVARLMQDPKAERQRFADWIDDLSADAGTPIMVYSTSDSEQVNAVHATFGRQQVCESVEEFHGDVTKLAVDKYGVRRLIVAGGETSGAVVKALGITRLRIGPEICAGVPWTEADGDPSLAIVLKSGNFGDDEFFRTTLEMLP